VTTVVCRIPLHTFCTPLCPSHFPPLHIHSYTRLFCVIERDSSIAQGHSGCEEFSS